MPTWLNLCKGIIIIFSSTVVLLCAVEEDEHKLLRAAQARGMTQGEYLFITLYHLPPSTIATPWIDPEDTELIEAYMAVKQVSSLQWRHNELDGVSDHQPHDCLLNRLFGRRSKKTSNLRVTGLCAGNSPGTGEFPAQKASNAENVSIWWRHHVSVVYHAKKCSRDCCGDMFWLHYIVIYLPTSSEVASLAHGQSYDCPSAG